MAAVMKRGRLALVAAASMAILLVVMAVSRNGVASSIQSNQSRSVSLEIYTFDPTRHNLKLINTQSEHGSSEYAVSSKVVSQSGTRSIQVSIDEELGDLICLCTTGEDTWSGKISSLTYGGSKFDGSGSLAKLSSDERGYYPCWRFTVKSEDKKLVDEGHSDTCRLKKFELGLKTKSPSNNEFTFVNVMRYMYDESETIGTISGTVKKSVEMKHGLGDMVCICNTKEDAWSGYLTELIAPRYDDDRREQVSLTGVSDVLMKLSTNDNGYFKCWRFDVDGWSTGSFSLVSLGGFSSCKIDDDGHESVENLISKSESANKGLLSDRNSINTYRIKLESIRSRMVSNRDENFKSNSITSFASAADQMSSVYSQNSWVLSQISGSNTKFNSYSNSANSAYSRVVRTRNEMFRWVHIDARNWKNLEKDTQNFASKSKRFAEEVRRFAYVMKSVPNEMKQVTSTVNRLAENVKRITEDVRDMASFGDVLLGRVKNSMSYAIQSVDQVRSEMAVVQKTQSQSASAFEALAQTFESTDERAKEYDDKIAQLSEEIVALKEENRELSEKVDQMDDLLAELSGVLKREPLKSDALKSDGLKRKRFRKKALKRSRVKSPRVKVPRVKDPREKSTRLRRVND